jgi:Lipopolysaccharide biosynthesis proteins, LPS:glycosyltransferases
VSAPLSIYLGYDPREHAAYEVADFSIRRRASVPVLITPLVLSQLGHLLTRPVERRDGQLYCPISQAAMSTEFAISRFCVPFLQRTGWALFADCDVLCLADIAELFALADPRYAVQVVKHAPMTATGTKMDGQLQTAYPRKNWSSVMLFNVGHPAHARLTLDALNTWPGRDLHAFRWLKDEEIGELPQTWNWLVGVSGRDKLSPIVPTIKLLHFTLGGPWFPEWIGGPCDELWIRERCSFTHSTAARPQ